MPTLYHSFSMSEFSFYLLNDETTRRVVVFLQAVEQF
jgi:hypothetical protein